jgi:site-specific recombinase XerD
MRAATAERIIAMALGIKGLRDRALLLLGFAGAFRRSELVALNEAAGITSGALFRAVKKGGRVAGRLSDQWVADIVKAYAERVGLEPALPAGHSLRAGFITSAAKRGASIFKMMDVSRHRSIETLRGYVRDAELFKDHAGAGLL